MNASANGPPGCEMELRLMFMSFATYGWFFGRWATMGVFGYDVCYG